MKSVFNESKRLKTLILFCIFTLNFQTFGQVQNETQILQPDQTIEREMTGAETHRYKFNLTPNEFFQVRVEQKGVDVSLKLLGADKKPLAEMDSPNGTEGFETLSFVAEKTGEFILEITNANKKPENAKYILKRQPSRLADEKDKRRVEAESYFVDAIKNLNSDRQISLEKLRKAYKSLAEVGDIDLKKIALEYADFQEMVIVFNDAHNLVLEAQKVSGEGREKSSLELINLSKQKIFEADAKYKKAEDLAQNLFKNHPEFVAKNSDLKTYPWLAKVSMLNVTSFLVTHYQYLLEPQKQLEYALIGIKLTNEARLIDVSDTGVKEENILLNETQALQHLASAMKENKNSEAINYYEQTLAKYRELKKLDSQFYQKGQEAGILQIIAFTYSELCKENNNYCKKKQIENYSEAIKLYEELADFKTVASIYLNIATIYYTEEPYKAFENLEKALSLAKKLDDKELISQVLFPKGALFLYLGNENKAKELFRQGLNISLSIPSYVTNIESADIPAFEKRNRLRAEYARLLGIASIYASLGEYSKAAEVAMQNHSIALQLQEKANIGFSLGHIASIFKDLKEWQKAIDY